MYGKNILRFFVLIIWIGALVGCGADQDQERADEINEADHEMEEMDEGEMDHNQTGEEERSGQVEGAEEPPKEFNENATNNLLHLSTKNITRINEDDPIRFSIMVSQTIWPATHKENQPGTVILAPQGQWQVALASVNLIHHPNDGPVLLFEGNNLNDLVINEIHRLQPKGNIEGTQIMVMGELADDQLNSLNQDFEVKQITSEDPAAFARDLDQIYSEITGSVPQGVIIGSSEEKAIPYTLPAGNWISHMEEPLLYVSAGDIPESTKEALEKRNGEANIYVLGPESIISEDLVNQLQEYGNVTRITGENPVEVSIQFAKFKDEQTNFGWGIDSPGHGLVFVSTTTPELAIAGAPFAHLGKHAPMVLLENGELTTEVYQYLGSLKPTFKDEPTEGPYNHGYVLGSEDIISYRTQGVIDEKLEIVSEKGDDPHGGH
ncbi:cell wall-binding repeat-containing protein [Anaerobacillus sp. MEB173]|uniref:cell wall-binding repeat-containing protein n=1 Tax=Anaerobacillus sp. MEB173 TaxID=3383345 RepID=UPI003F912379